MTLLDPKGKKRAARQAGLAYRACPNCGEKSGTIGDILGLSVAEHAVPSGIRQGEKVLLVLPVACEHCGYISFFQGQDFLPDE